VKNKNYSCAGLQKVRLSKREKIVEKLRKALEDIPDIRVDRVEQLKKAIQRGAYRVDSEKIAQKILEEL